MAHLHLLRSLIYRLSLLVVLLHSPLTKAADPAELFEKLSPSVWVVVVSDKNGITLGTGSGVVISPERLITNCHVLRKASSVVVKRDNTAHAARLEHSDVERDLCTLIAKNLSAPALKIAPLSTARVGQKIITIGAPRGLELTLSDGLISSLRKGKSDAVEDIQITAPISSGSSGGGLFNMNGELLGVTSATLRDSQNINFAIPADWIKEVAARGEAAIAKQKAEQEKLAQERKQVTAGNFQARQLRGEELLAFMKKAMGLAENDANYIEGSGNIESVNDSVMTIQLMRKKWAANAQFSVKESQSELCITQVDRGNGDARATHVWIGLAQCYRVFEYAPEKFALRGRDLSAKELLIK